MLGSLGPVIFEVSAERVRTFDKLKRNGTGRWATHEIIGKKSVLEFLGPEIEEISFSMRFDVMLGLNPSDEVKVLRDLRDTGEVVSLIIGGKPVTENKWVVISVSEDNPYIDNKGNILVINVDVSIKEYVCNSS